MFEGAGRSTSASFAIFSRGCVLRRAAIRALMVEVQQWFFKSQVQVRILVRVYDRAKLCCCVFIPAGAILGLV